MTAKRNCRPVARAAAQNTCKGLIANEDPIGSATRRPAQARKRPPAALVEYVNSASLRYRDYVTHLPAVTFEQARQHEAERRPMIVAHHVFRCPDCNEVGCAEHAVHGSTSLPPPDPFYQADCGCRVTFHADRWRQ